MRVALLAPTWWPEVRRGSERFIRDLADGLLAAGHQATLITSHPGRPSRSVEDGLEVIRNWRPPEGRLRRRGYQPFLTHLPFSYQSLTRGSFDVAPALFSRAVNVSVSHDGKTWSPAGFGNIERTTRQEQISVTIPEQWARFLRLAIRNEDNPPLTITRVRVEEIKRELIFPAETAGSYWLYSGNGKADPARYDLRAVLADQVGVVPATLGSIQNNPNYEAPKPPVTERSPWLLPTLLLVLVPALGATAFRMLRRVGTPQ